MPRIWVLQSKTWMLHFSTILFRYDKIKVDKYMIWFKKSKLKNAHLMFPYNTTHDYHFSQMSQAHMNSTSSSTFHMYLSTPLQAGEWISQSFQT